ncbi:MAG: ABC transporter permease [Actinomycetales bacterium]|nr:ABC transporter permease [Actinomycetales bacterium]
MSALTGTRELVRLALRLDRVRLPIWVLGIAVLPMTAAAQYLELYPTEESIREVGGFTSSTSLVALSGPMFRVSVGGLTAWKTLVTALVLVGLMSLFTVVRHTRAEEETGRLELVGAVVVGRLAPLTAALLTAGLANLAVALLTALGLLGTGLPAAGAVAMGLAVGSFGVVLTAVAAVAVQLTEGSRAANGIGAAVLGGVYLLRAVGDTGPVWLSWLSPLGWAMRIRPYAGERWWPLGLVAGLVVVLCCLAYVLAGRRDLGAGMLPQRPGPAVAAPGLRSALALAWRLHRGTLVGWVIAMALAGAIMGGAAAGLPEAFGSNRQVADVMARMGGSKGLVDMYLATVFGIIGLTAAAYTVQATLRLRAEEAGGRVEPLLATAVPRTRLALSHLGIALLGTAVLLAVSGLCAGLGYGIQVHDVGGQVPRLLAAGLVQFPAAGVIAGLGTALFGLVPRASQLTWAALVACLVLLELGALLGLDQWVVDVSPFAHVPKLPGSAVETAPLAWLVAVSVVLVGVGLAGFRRRDVR